jgi:hypothetical protein
MRKIAITLITAAFAVCAHADPNGVTLTLTPTSGDVAGAPGTAIGWGFTLTDTGSDYVILDDSFLTSVATSGYGNYVDYIVNQFVEAGPSPESPTVSQTWDSTLQTGVGEFDLAASDSYPQNFSGTITVQYDLFSGDPSLGASTDLGQSSITLPVDIQVTPEPSSWLLLATGLAALMGFAWRKFGVVNS